MKQMIKPILRPIVALGAPFTYLSSLWLKAVLKVNDEELDSKRTRIGDDIFMHLGILPMLDQYYQPMINPKKHLTKSLREDRDLPGIDLNVTEQLQLLQKFNYNHELENLPLEKTEKTEFYYNNGAYQSGDAEYLYNIIRYFKPKRFIEIGCGSSTLMAAKAIQQNMAEDTNYTCRHTCIEPYEQPWLEKLGVEVIRERVEKVNTDIFLQLEANDILFIDSSHIIRPQGDVLFEYLQLLPVIKTGVLVHVHDIFTPKDYLNEWVEKHILWNEQYLLEAFLSFNTHFRIIGALNYLSHHHRTKLTDKCPVFKTQPTREPGAFWMVRN